MMYELIETALNTAQLFEDWDRQGRFRNENDIITRLAGVFATEQHSNENSCHKSDESIQKLKTLINH